MEIIIITPDSITKQVLRINLNIKISELKQRIQKATKISPPSQIIHHNNKNITNIKSFTLHKILDKIQLSAGTTSNVGYSIVNTGEFFFVSNSDLIKISIRTPRNHLIRLSVNNKKMKIIELQKNLETETGIPIQVQAIYHKDVNLSLSQKTLLQLGISRNAQLILWDKEDSFRIFIQLPNSQKEEKEEEILSMEVSPYETLTKVQNRLEKITNIPIHSQLFTRNGINLTPQSSLTIRQLKIISSERFVLYDRYGIIIPLIYINIHLDNGDIREYQLSQLQIIRMLIQDYLRQSSRYKDTVTFVCRPSADGSSPKYENAIDETMTFADLHIKNGDSLCVSTISKGQNKSRRNEELA